MSEERSRSDTHAEDALRQSEALLQSIFRAAPIGIGMVCDRVLKFANAQLCGMTGYSSAELVGRLSRVLYPSDEEFEFVGREKYRQIAAHGTGTVETRWKHKNGSMLDVLLSSTPLDPDDQSKGVTFTALDITLRKRAERERTRLAAIVEATTDFVSIADVEGRVLYINSAGWRLLEREPWRDPVGRIADVHPAWASKLVFSTALPAAARDGTWSGESALLTREGQEIPTSQVVIAHRSASGEIEFYSTIMRDLRELRTAKEQAEQIAAQYRQAQKMEAVGRLAGGVAHDFNNLLMAIQGYADLLRRRLDDEVDRRHAEQIGEATARAAALTRQLLAFGRKQMLQPKVVNLNDVITETRTLLERLIGENIQVVTRLAPDLGYVRIDPAQIGQALVNLGINARDAMPTGGRLVIETANVDAGFSGDREAIRSPLVSLNVSDTGVGMAPEVVERAFEPFFTTKPGAEGSGLGLSMVHGTVEQSGGRIEVSSKPGQGATFTLTFPRLEVMAEAPETPTDLSKVPSGRERILLVEDSGEVRDVVQETLEQLGYRVLVTADGESALRVADGPLEPVQLLLTDVVLPGISGTELARRIRVRFPGLAVLLMSGYPEDPSLHDAIGGVVSFVPKPLSMEKLAFKVREALDLPRRF